MIFPNGTFTSLGLNFTPGWEKENEIWFMLFLILKRHLNVEENCYFSCVQISVYLALNIYSVHAIVGLTEFVPRASTGEC